MTLMTNELDAVTRSANSTPFFIFNLFADYILPYREGWAWTQDLIYLLGLLGLSERAARTTLARMKTRGWFETVKDGRRSRYMLTDLGRAIVAEGDKRIFEEPAPSWDGQWQLVVYSLPEELRVLRNELRKKLVWFGFGNLAPGAWVAAQDRRPEVEELVSRLEIAPYVSLFAGPRIGLMSDAEIVARCWDLPALAAGYDVFLARWQPRLATLAADLEAVPLAERFQQRFWLTFAFQPFPRQDPNLPMDLLPPDWPGFAARALFLHYRELLSAGLPEFLAELPA